MDGVLNNFQQITVNILRAIPFSYTFRYTEKRIILSNINILCDFTIYSTHISYTQNDFKKLLYSQYFCKCCTFSLCRNNGEHCTDDFQIPLKKKSFFSRFLMIPFTPIILHFLKSNYFRFQAGIQGISQRSDFNSYFYLLSKP